MRYHPITITDEQRANLTRLADVLDDVDTMRALNPHLGFSMALFEEEIDGCGTTACAAGWGPTAGIPKLSHECWLSYCGRAFGSGSFAADDLRSRYHMQQYLFGGDWAHVDQSPSGAATRIRIVLKHGVPVDYDEAEEWQGIDFNAAISPGLIPL